MDSPWALTSVSQDQFWHSVDLSEYGDGEVKGILSVDISDWDTPGMLYGKPAKECDPVEIKNEVWLQILAHLDADGQKQLRAAKIMRWFLDPSITYPNPSQAVNLEPLLINTVGSLADRPHAYTEIPNLFLAADYVRTGTDLACMESANEAARRATNAAPRSSGVALHRERRSGRCSEPAILSPLQGVGSIGVRARRAAFVAERRVGGVHPVGVGWRPARVVRIGHG